MNSRIATKIFGWIRGCWWNDDYLFVIFFIGHSADPPLYPARLHWLFHVVWCWWDCVVVRCWCDAGPRKVSRMNATAECASAVPVSGLELESVTLSEHWQRFPNSGHKTDQVSRSSLITRCEWVSAMWTLHRIVIITMHQPVAAHNARMEPRATTWHTHCNRGWCGGAVTRISYFCTIQGGGHCIALLCCMSFSQEPGVRLEV